MVQTQDLASPAGRSDVEAEWWRAEFKLSAGSKMKKYPAILISDKKGKLKKVL